MSQTQIDGYGALITDYEYGHLFHFADRLKEDPKAIGAIKIFKDKHEPIGVFLRHFYGVNAFMIESFGVSPAKFDVVYGGEDVRKTEIYLASVDDSMKPTGLQLDGSLRGKISRRTLFDLACIDCDSSPFINQFIFREGIDHLAKALIANPNTYSVIAIARVEYLSRTAKERRNLSKGIYERLLQNGLSSRNRVRLRFVTGSFAQIHIIPNRPKHRQ